MLIRLTQHLTFALRTILPSLALLAAAGCSSPAPFGSDSPPVRVDRSPIARQLLGPGGALRPTFPAQPLPALAGTARGDPPRLEPEAGRHWLGTGLDPEGPPRQAPPRPRPGRAPLSRE